MPELNGPSVFTPLEIKEVVDLAGLMEPQKQSLIDGVSRERITFFHLSILCLAITIQGSMDAREPLLPKPTISLNPKVLYLTNAIHIHLAKPERTELATHHALQLEDQDLSPNSNAVQSKLTRMVRVLRETQSRLL